MVTSDKLRTIRQQYDALPKSAPERTWIWVTVLDGQRHITSAIPPGEVCTPRIEVLDKGARFACYRNMHYLGSEETLDEAKMRCAVNRMSDANEVMRIWEREHPNELPPFLQLTPEERAAYWHHNPPKAAPRPMTKRALPDPTPGVGDGSPGKAPGRAKRTPRTAPAALVGTLARAKEGNPKKAGTGAHKRWETLFSYVGKNVTEYEKDGGNMDTLANAIKAGYVRVEEK